MKTDRSLATRTALTARALFAARGYTAVGAEEIVRAAGVTRGAYHHFDGKLELFAAVYEQVEAELVQSIAAAVDTPGAGAARRPALRLAGLPRRVPERPAVQRIALLDAPSEFGWERWREIGFATASGSSGNDRSCDRGGEVEPSSPPSRSRTCCSARSTRARC